ncbi:MAG: DUF2341 domain-containing protein [Thermoguttaceae bacterium]
MLAGWLPEPVPITVVNNNSGSALSYFQVGISITGAAYTYLVAKGQSALQDLRLTDQDGVSLLNFLFENALTFTTDSAIYLLVKVPAIAAGATRTLYAWIGNSTATSVSSAAGAIQPTTALSGPTDIIAQASYPGYNTESHLLLLKNQGGVNGGGSSYNGQVLLFAQVEGTSNTNPAGAAIVQAISSNGGVTFGSFATIATPASTYAFVLFSALELADGSIVICYSYALGTTFTSAFENFYFAKLIGGPAGTWTNFSTSPANPVSVPWTYGTDAAGFDNGLVEVTPGGDLLATCHATITATGYWHAYILKCPSGSDPTNGGNWITQGTIAYDTTNEWCEAALLKVSSQYISVLRNNNQGDLWLTTSTNECATWATPTAIFGFPGIGTPATLVSPHLLQLASGNILLSMGFRMSPGGGHNWGIGCALSTDGGATFIDRPIVLPLSYAAGAAPGDYGYPSAVQLSNGNILWSGYHEVGESQSTTNIALAVATEDWVANVANVIETCQSLSSWTSVGTAAISSTHVFQGSDSIIFDNSAGHPAAATRQLWNTAPGTQPQALAYSYWIYITQVTTSGINLIALDTNAGEKIQTAVFPTPYHLEWYNGSAWTDMGVVVPFNQWVKHTISATTPTGSVSGTWLQDDVTEATGIGQGSGTGYLPENFKCQAGSGGTNYNTTNWIGSLYSHQFTAAVPTVTVGAVASLFGGSVLAGL